MQIFLKPKKKIYVKPKTPILLRDVCEITCDQTIKKQAEETQVSTGCVQIGSFSLPILLITEKVSQAFPTYDIQYINEEDVLIIVKENDGPESLKSKLKAFLVYITIFFGTAFSIVYFYEDVGISSTMKKITYVITGLRQDIPIFLVFSFTLGVALGMLIFFTNSVKKNVKVPTPLELKADTYQNDTNDYIMNNSEVIKE